MSGAMRPGPSLSLAAGTHPVYNTWLAGEGGSSPAGREMAAIAAVNGDTPAPWFGSPEAASWAVEQIEDLAEAPRNRFETDLAALRAGTAGVVVTGQQPGFLGGPLLTIHKIATAVALAERLTAAGKPTIPVFWSGDADDDLLEALLPVAWLPGTDRLVRSEGLPAVRRGQEQRQRLGTLPVGRWQGAGRDWFAAAASGRDDLGLAELWSATAQGTWARRQRRALQRIFAGSGLMIVSGDDPLIHRAGAPYYRNLDGRREELAALARARGAQMAAGGSPVPISDRSLARPLYRVENTRRVVLQGAVPTDTSVLRPGVMLRSPLQDWLLAPRAVVVGPGELAYLRQLEPVHQALGIPRCALVPRLSCWLLPAGMDPELLASHRRAAAASPTRLPPRAEVWLAGMSGDLAGLLGDIEGVATARARDLADRRARRWARGVRSLLRGELARARSAGPRQPVWVFPDGQRQERALAWGAILGLGGRPLRELILEAARRHLDAGSTGTWCEWECDWDEPTS